MTRLRSTIMLYDMIAQPPMDTTGVVNDSATDQRLAISHPVIDQWLRGVNAHSIEEVCALYDPEAILLPTLSGVICDSPAQIRNYFESFLRRPKLSATLTSCYVQQYSEIKIDSGIYQFEWEDRTSGTVSSTSARFTFVIRNHLIVEHHSSMTPDDHA